MRCLPDRPYRFRVAQGAADQETLRLVTRLPPDGVHLSVDVAGSIPAEGFSEEREHLTVGSSSPAHLVSSRTMRLRLVAEHVDSNLRDVGGPVETRRHPVKREVVLDALRIHDLRELCTSLAVRN